MIKPAHVRMARAGLGWTLNDLAKRADVNPNTLSRYESGRDILAGTLGRIEHTLQIAGVIFSEDDDRLGVKIIRTHAEQP